MHNLGPGRLALIAALLWSGGCQFAPRFAGGTTRCSSAGRCPEGFVCAADSNTCCRPKDGACLAKGSDAAVAGDGSPPGGDGAEGSGAGAQPDAGAASFLSARRIVDFPVHIYTCTHAVDDLADVWCLFGRAQELWALDVTKVKAGDVACNGADPSCLRLTSKLYENKTRSATTPVVNGQFVSFFADAMGSPAALTATIYGWYPGWATARKLTDGDGYSCSGSPAARAVGCTENLVAPGKADFRAGFLDADAPLALIEKAAAPPIVAAFLTVDGERMVAVQAKPNGGSGWMVPTRQAADVGKRQPITEAIVSWQVPRFETNLFVLHHDTDPTDVTSATFSVVDLTKAPSLRDLADRVGQFAYIRGPGQVSVAGMKVYQDLRDGVGTLKLFLGPSLSEINVGKSGVNTGVSRDSRYTFFQPVVDPATGLGDARVMDNRSGKTCVLQRLPQTRVDTWDTFSENGEVVLWQEPPGPAGYGSGWLARAGDCSDKRKFSDHVAGVWFVKSTGLLYLEDEFERQTLHYVKWDAGTSWPKQGPARWQEDVSEVVLLEPATVLFTSNEPGNEGLYVSALP